MMDHGDPFDTSWDRAVEETRAFRFDPLSGVASMAAAMAMLLGRPPNPRLVVRKRPVAHVAAPNWKADRRKRLAVREMQARKQRRREASARGPKL